MQHNKTTAAPSAPRRPNRESGIEKVTYNWSPNFHIPSSLPVEQAAEIFLRYRPDGTADKVTAAEAYAIIRDLPEDDPYRMFVYELDDADAADAWRLTRVKYLIQAFKVTYYFISGKTVNVRSTVSVETTVAGKRHHGYLPMHIALAPDSDTRDQVLDRALRDFQALADKYRCLTEFSWLISKIDSLVIRERTKLVQRRHSQARRRKRSPNRPSAGA